ncbi:OmpH family outer membrane protein [Pelagibacterales bacterium SAG-MED20]|nr:OmpH family outer membrane protein [Pelagibacterales bacterium SAG-MED20]
MNSKKAVKILIVFFLFFNFKLLQADEKIVYIDMNKIMTSSSVAKSVSIQLDKYNKDNTIKFKKNIDDLQAQEKKLISQKNILDENEFKKQYEEIKTNFSKHNKSIENFNKDFNNKTIKSRAFILEQLTPILSNYAKNNSTSLILNKKNVVIGKTDLDITDEIIIILNEKVKEIKLDNIK